LWGLQDVESNHSPVNINEHFGQYAGTVAFSSSGSHFAISCDDAIYLCDTESRECQSRIKLEGKRQWAFSPNDQQIAIGTKEGGIYLWDLQSEVPCSKLGEHKGLVCFAYSPCGQWIALGGSSKVVEIWRRREFSEAESWSKVHSISALFDFILKLAWNPVVPMEFVIGTWNGSIQVWRISIDNDGNITDKMVWGPRRGILYAEGAIFTKAVGLCPIYQKLLVQRGALHVSEEPVFSHV
jgi:WD40 repeat protein